ncbi:MAG: hypothetical protein ABGX40_08405 [Methylococcales bacterium]
MTRNRLDRNQEPISVKKVGVNPSPGYKSVKAAHIFRVKRVEHPV